jgi:hypothetical protein
MVGWPRFAHMSGATKNIGPVFLKKKTQNLGFRVFFRALVFVVVAVIDHEAVPMDPKLFSSWVHRSLVLLRRGFGQQTSKQPVALLASREKMIG